MSAVGKVSVSADALRAVLQALLGPSHYIRELQVLSNSKLPSINNPIGKLVDEFNQSQATPQSADDTPHE